MEKPQKAHIVWIDLLRIIACFMVMLSHSCDFFVSQFDNNRLEFLSGASIGSMVRPCVPLFVMISGILLLPVKLDMGTFYNRRLKRIIIPLVFWSLVLPVFYFFYLSNVETASPTIDMTDHTLTASLTKMGTFVFNFNYDTIPFWYLYMLIGIYLFIPIIGAWLAQASQRDIKRFLYIWGITLVLPYIQLFAPMLGYNGNYGNMGLWGVCDWNPYGTFYYFSGFLGYIVLAHYLVRFPLEWSWKRTLGTAIPLFLIGYAITLIGFITIQTYYPANYSYLEIVWYFSGINVFLMTYSLFIVVQKLRVNPSAMITKIASLTFGIYLCHFIIVQAGYDIVHTALPIPPYLQIPIIALFAFSVSALLIWLMGKVKFLKMAAGL